MHKTPLISILSLLALSACGLSGPAHDPVKPGIVGVDMGFASFEPATIHIKAGQTVAFRNNAVITHTVTDDPKLAMDPKDASGPAGAAIFNSGDIPPGQVFTQTFTVPGTYVYFCMHHEDDGMVATVIVDPAS
jgi:plastocyanin